MTETVLLYVGAILIAYEVAGEASHLPALVIALVSHSVDLGRVVDRCVEKFPKALRISIKILIRAIMLPIFITVIALAVLLFGLWLIGLVIKLIDAILNKVYRFEVRRIAEQEPKVVMGILHVFLPKIKDEEISSAMGKVKVPFLAFVGVALLTVGLILELISLS